MALIIRADYEPKEYNFVTHPDNPLQFGIFRHKRGATIKPHIHRDIERTIDKIQEALYLTYGKVEVQFYDPTGRKIESTILYSGDAILLISGGHGFNILEDSKIIEIKQGPYSGVNNDKLRFDI